MMMGEPELNAGLLGVEPWWVACLGLFSDGTVRVIDVKTGNPLTDPTFGEFETWHDICSLDSSRSHVVGLRRDGCVEVFARSYFFERYRAWTDIVQVKSGYEHTYALKKDGSVLIERNGKEEEISKAEGTKIIDPGFGLDSQGNLYSLDRGGKLAGGWNDVVELASTNHDVYGLRSDGTVACLNRNEHVEQWCGIVQIAAGNNHVVGLRGDGSVAAFGSNCDNACDVADWRDIRRISAGCYHTVGIDGSGSLLTANDDWNRH